MRVPVCERGMTCDMYGSLLVSDFFFFCDGGLLLDCCNIILLFELSCLPDLGPAM
jgi:hypothetical protein